MKKFKLLPTLLILLFAYQAHASEAEQEQKSCCARACKAMVSAMCVKPCKDFARNCLGDKTNTPPEVTTILNQHNTEIKDFSKQLRGEQLLWGKGVWQPEWLPGYFIKGGIERVINAQRLQQFIDENNLDQIAVAKKYLYHVPGRPYKLSSDNYLVITQKAEGVHSDWESLSPTQHAQLLKVMDIHNDLDYKNFLVTPEKVTIVDTDSRSMPTE